MRKLILLFLLFFSVSAFGQTAIRFGLEAGPNMTFPEKNAYDNSISAKYGVGIWGGALMEASLNNSSANPKLQLEFLYNNLHQNFNDQGGYIHWQFQQIVMPLTMKFFLSPHVSINAGVDFSFNLSANYKEKNGGVAFDTTLERGDLTMVQVGATGGINYYFNKGIFLNLRYNYMFGPAVQKGFSDIATPNFKFNNIQLGIGFMFSSFSPDVPGSGD